MDEVSAHLVAERRDLAPPQFLGQDYCPRCRTARVPEAVFCHACGFRFPLTPDQQDLVRTVAHACKVCGNIDTVSLGPLPEPKSEEARQAVAGENPLHLSEGPQAPDLSRFLPDAPEAPKTITITTIVSIGSIIITCIAFISWLFTLFGGRLIRENTVNIAWFFVVATACITLLAVLNARREQEDVSSEFTGAMSRYVRARKTWPQLVYCARCEYVSNTETGETAPAKNITNLFM